MARSAASEFYEAGGATAGRFHAAPVNAKAADGSWQRADPNLREVRGGDWTAWAGHASARFAQATDDGPLAVMTGEGWSVGFSFEGATRNRKGEANGTRILYRQVRPGIDLSYEVSPGAIKEDVVLTRRPPAKGPGILRFDLQLKGVTPKAGTDGSVLLDNAAGTTVAVIPAGVALDSAQPPASSPVGIELVRRQGGYAIELRPDLAWLAQSERRYPVRLDPPINLTATGPSAVVLRPDSLVAGGAWSPVGPSGTTAVGATADDGDGTWLVGGAASGEAVFGLADPALPAGSTIESVRTVTRWSAQVGDERLRLTQRVGSAAATPDESTLSPTPPYAWTNRPGLARTTAPGGGSWSPAALNDLQVALVGLNSVNNGPKLTHFQRSKVDPSLGSTATLSVGLSSAHPQCSAR